MTLRGRTALVTGASRGIGHAIAFALAEAGAHVLAHYGRSAQDAESLVANIRSKGGGADAIRADLGTREGATLLAKEVRSIVGNRLDVLVLNAGISKAARIADYTVADFDNLFATNVRSPFFLVQQLLPTLGQGSNIIAISSLGARAVVGTPDLDKPSILAYAATKGAIETLVKNWASILGPRGIRVNAVAPGVIDTDMSNFTKTEAGREVTLGMQALKRIGKPEDVADVIVFLASDKARWITGASIPVDGDRNFNSLAAVSVIRPTDQSEEADMSNISTIRSSAKKDRTNVPQPEKILSHRGTLGDSAVADGNRQNDIRLRAYEIYVQREQEPSRAMDDWLRAEREYVVLSKRRERVTPIRKQIPRPISEEVRPHESGHCSWRCIPRL